MSFEKNGLRFSAAVLLAMVLGSYVFANTADASGSRSISYINSSVEVDASDRVGDVSSINGNVHIERDAVAREVSTVNGRIEVRSGASIESAETVNGGIELDGDVEVEGSLRTVNGEVRSREGSVVDGEIKTVNGDIELRGTHVRDDVVTSNGDIEISAASEIDGDIIVRGKRGWIGRLFSFGQHYSSKLNISADSVIHGDIHLYREVDLNIDDDAQIGDIITHY